MERIIDELKVPCTGFFTKEIKEEGKRRGFSIITLKGGEGILAHENLASKARVGKYAVNLEALEKIAIPALTPSKPEEIVIIDEIGKMECLSPLFREALLRTLNAPNPVIATIALQGNPFIESIKKRNDVRIFNLTEEKREALIVFLKQEIYKYKNSQEE